MKEPAWLVPALETIRGLGERLPHALMIHGPGGWGEERIANALAVDLMRLAPGREARDVAHPDLRWLSPEGGMIKVDDIRAIVDFLVQTPQVAGRKIAVIEDADRMNVNAANALLKSLEEPPPESFIALSTGAAERLPATVRSRCQRLEVQRGDGRTVHAWLLEAGVAEDLIEPLAMEHGGAPFAILAAAEGGQAPLWPVLAKVARTPAAAGEVALVNREEKLADVVDRWLRIAHWLVRQWPVTSAALALPFVDELLRTRQAALLNTGLNRSMQLHRLALLWADLWQRLPMQPPASTSP